MRHTGRVMASVMARTVSADHQLVRSQIEQVPFMGILNQDSAGKSTLKKGSVWDREQRVPFRMVLHSGWSYPRSKRVRG